MIRIGMVGGGSGSFIGNVQRIATRMDGLFEWKAEVFSSDAERRRTSGAEIGVEPRRVCDIGKVDALVGVILGVPHVGVIEQDKVVIG